MGGGPPPSASIKRHYRTATTFTISFITYYKDKIVLNLSIVNEAECFSVCFIYASDNIQ